MEDKSQNRSTVVWVLALILAAILVCACFFAARYVRKIKNGGADNEQTDFFDRADVQPTGNKEDSESSSLEHIVDDTPVKEEIPYECP